VTGRWFSPGTPVSSINKTDSDYITEILLKVGLNTIHIKQWIGEADNMEAKDWGWSIEHNMYVPIRSSLPPAPDELLKTIYCRCKLDETLAKYESVQRLTSEAKTMSSTIEE
jgi:hypothetical protein